LADGKDVVARQRVTAARLLSTVLLSDQSVTMADWLQVFGFRLCFAYDRAASYKPLNTHKQSQGNER
jgi:hypothetical protein